jgi:dihydroflavonol-4-reductase
VEVVRGDVTNPKSLRGSMENIDATFHLAALVESWTRDPRDFVRVNVGGTDNVIHEALRAGVWRLVFTSSLSGIGVRPGEVLREDSPSGKAFGPYEDSKAVAERHVAAAVVERGLPAVILIPGIVIGPGDVRNTGKMLLSFVRGEFPGTFAEDSYLPVVGVDDVARAHLLAYEHGRVGERYIICSENVPWGDLMRIASEASGTPMPSRHIGGRALWLASRTGELLSRVTRAPPRLPSWLADFMLTGARMDNSKSIRELQMTYRPIADSIREAIEWFEAEGLLKAAPPAPRAPHVVRLPVENPRVGAEAAFAERELGEPPERGPLEGRPKPPKKT